MNPMNRRKLLSSGLLAAGGLVAVSAFGQQKEVTSPGLPPAPPTGPHTPPVGVNSGTGTFDPATAHTAGAMNAALIGSLVRGNATKQDFLNASASLAAMRDSWRNAGFDQKIIPGVNAITENRMTVGYMGTHVDWAAHTVAVYNPSVTVPQAHTVIDDMLHNTVVGGIDAKTKTLQTMRAGGSSTLIEAGIVYMNTLASKIPPPRMSKVNTKTFQAQLLIWPPSGGGGDNPNEMHDTACAVEDWTSYGLGALSVILAVLTDGLSLLGETAAAAIGYWAGIGSLALGTQQKIMC
jgi:hypothetical protein